MKKIFLWGYWAKNFGDDLFLKVYLDQNYNILKEEYFDKIKLM